MPWENGGGGGGGGGKGGFFFFLWREVVCGLGVGGMGRGGGNVWIFLCFMDYGHL